MTLRYPAARALLPSRSFVTNHRRLIYSIPLLFFFIDLFSTPLVFFAYLQAINLTAGELTSEFILPVAGVYVLRTGFWVLVLLGLLWPVKRWTEQPANVENRLSGTARALRVVYSLPLKSGFLFALSWTLPYLLIGVWLDSGSLETIQTRPGHMVVTVLFAAAVFGGSFLIQFAFLGWMLAPLTEILSLEALRRDIAVPWHGYSTQTRMVALALLLTTSPTLWVASLAYASEAQQIVERENLRAQTITSGLAGTLERDELEGRRDLKRLPGITERYSAERSRSFVLDLERNVVLGDGARRFFEADPGVEEWVFRIAEERDAGIFRFEDRRLSFAVQRATYADTPVLLGTIAWQSVTVSPEFLVSMLLFGAVVVAWSVLTAIFIASVLGGSIARTTSLVSEIARKTDARHAGHVPILQQNELGRLAASVNFMTDRLAVSATEQENAQERIVALAKKLERRAAELRGVLEHMVEAVIVCDRSGTVTIANRSARELFGVDELEGLSTTDLVRWFHLRDIEGNDLSPELHPLIRALNGNATIRQTLVFPAVGGQRMLLVSAAPVHYAQGAIAIAGALSVSSDITELQELDRLKDEFIKVAAHELKTPVAIVKGYAQLLHRLAPDLPEQKQRIVRSMESGADRINRTVNYLIEISVLYAEGREFILEPTDWCKMMGELVQEAQSHTTRHRIRWNGPPEMPVDAEPARLRQVGRQLLSNAVKYSPDGGDIDVSLLAEDGTALLSVSDTGIGIPEAKQVRIFESFYRAHTDTPYDYGGMGVGLHISREIVHRHRGRIWFESEEGKGSTFYVRLPTSGRLPEEEAATDKA